MDEELQRVARIVERGEGTPDEIQKYIRMKLRGGCAAGAHGVLVPAAVDDDRLVCEVCRRPLGFAVEGAGKMLTMKKGDTDGSSQT